MSASSNNLSSPTLDAVDGPSDEIQALFAANGYQFVVNEGPIAERCQRTDNLERLKTQSRSGHQKSTYNNAGLGPPTSHGGRVQHYYTLFEDNRNETIDAGKIPEIYKTCKASGTRQERKDTMSLVALTAYSEGRDPTLSLMTKEIMDRAQQSLARLSANRLYDPHKVELDKYREVLLKAQVKAGLNSGTDVLKTAGIQSTITSGMMSQIQDEAIFWELSAKSEWLGIESLNDRLGLNDAVLSVKDKIFASIADAHVNKRVDLSLTEGEVLELYKAYAEAESKLAYPTTLFDQSRKLLATTPELTPIEDRAEMYRKYMTKEAAPKSLDDIRKRLKLLQDSVLADPNILTVASAVADIEALKAELNEHCRGIRISDDPLSRVLASSWETEDQGTGETLTRDMLLDNLLGIVVMRLSVAQGIDSTHSRNHSVRRGIFRATHGRAMTNGEAISMFKVVDVGRCLQPLRAKPFTEVWSQLTREERQACGDSLQKTLEALPSTANDP